MIDDVFVLFDSPEHSYLNSCHLNIPFTIIENEKDNKMSFLDVKIIREKGKFITSVYLRPTLAEFPPILTVSYHPVTKLACYIHYYIDVSGFAQIGLSFT